MTSISALSRKMKRSLPSANEAPPLPKGDYEYHVTQALWAGDRGRYGIIRRYVQTQLGADIIPATEAAAIEQAMKLRDVTDRTMAETLVMLILVVARENAASDEPRRMVWQVF